MTISSFLREVLEESGGRELPLVHGQEAAGHSLIARAGGFGHDVSMNTENESKKDEGELSVEKLEQVSGGARLSDVSPEDLKGVDLPVYTNPGEDPMRLL